MTESSDDMFAPIGGTQRDCPVCGDSMFPCEECAAREIPPGEVPTELLNGTETAEMGAETNRIETSTVEIGAETAEIADATAHLDSQGQPYCPDCRVVLGSLIPCAACEARGVAPGETNTGELSNPFETNRMEFEHEVEVEKAPFAIGGFDEMTQRLLVVLGIFFVLYQGLAWTARSAPHREMPTAGIRVGEVITVTSRASRKVIKSQGLRELQESIKLFRNGDYLSAQRRAEVARDLYMAEGVEDSILAEAYVVIASCLVARNRREEGLTALDKAIELDPQNGDYREKRKALGQNVTQIRDREVQGAVSALREAHVLFRDGKKSEAERLVKQTLPRLKELKVSPKLLGQGHALLGAISLSEGETGKALKHLRRAYALDPDPEYKKAIDGLR